MPRSRLTSWVPGSLPHRRFSVPVVRDHCSTVTARYPVILGRSRTTCISPHEPQFFKKASTPPRIVESCWNRSRLPSAREPLGLPVRNALEAVPHIVAVARKLAGLLPRPDNCALGLGHSTRPTDNWQHRPLLLPQPTQSHERLTQSSNRNTLEHNLRKQPRRKQEPHEDKNREKSLTKGVSSGDGRVIEVR